MPIFFPQEGREYRTKEQPIEDKKRTHEHFIREALVRRQRCKTISALFLAMWRRWVSHLDCSDVRISIQPNAEAQDSCICPAGGLRTPLGWQALQLLHDWIPCANACVCVRMFSCSASHVVTGVHSHQEMKRSFTYERKDRTSARCRDESSNPWKPPGNRESMQAKTTEAELDSQDP